MGVPFRITIPDLLSMEERFAAAPQLVAETNQKALTKAAIGTQAAVMAETPVRHGILRKSIFYEVGKGEAVVYVDPKVKYAGAVEHGSGLYGQRGAPIEPTNKRVMATKLNPGWGSANSGGYFIIGTYQRGQEANPFFERGFTTAKPIVVMTFAEANKLITRKLAG